MDEYFDINQRLWNALTPIHERSAFYNVAAFQAGGLTLNPIELEQLGDVRGKRLLHLQCHFGLDTLSWARRGAHVTGVDFSEPAIARARDLAREAGLDATFLCANVYDVPNILTDPFDIVYSSYGAIPWLPDLGRWARVVNDCLIPGGSFHLIEFHPVIGMLDEDGHTLKHPYFEQPEPARFHLRGSYAEPGADFSHDVCEWSHSLADVFEALLQAGLTIQRFQEFPFSPYGCFQFLEERAPGQWWVRDLKVAMPITFAIHAMRST